MGLLQKVSNSGAVSEKQEDTAAQKIPVQKKSNSVGLLKKSLIISNEDLQADKLDFFEFIQLYNINLCSVLKPSGSDKSYIAVNCIGLDADSICLSVSSNDFWNGLIKLENELYTFTDSDNSILPLYQFFSKTVKEKLNTLYALKRSDETIVLFCTTQDFEKSFIINDIKNLNCDFSSAKAYSPEKSKYENSKSYYLYQADFSKAIDSFTASKCNSENSSQIKKAIYLNTFYELLQNFPEPSFISMNSGSIIKIAWCVENEIPLEVISNHFRFNISYIFNEQSNQLSIQSKGKAASYSELKDFLDENRVF